MLAAVDGVETALANLLTELGQKVESVDTSALSTAAKQDTAQTTLGSILTSVDGLEGKDYATQTTLAAVLAKLIAAPATEAKQDSIVTAVQAVSTAVEELAELTEVQPVSDNGSSLTVDAPLGTPVAARLSDGTSALGTTGGRLHTQVATELPAGTQNIGDVDVASVPSASSATVTQVASSASSVTLQASNSSRKGLSVFNDSTSALFLKFGATASATSFTVKIGAGEFWEMPVSPLYTGRVDGIWSSANGNSYVTET